jgi:DNA-binding response OmpR family regulator
MAVVLLVEDDPENLLLVTELLSRSGHRVLTAVDGPGGLDSARAWRPDVILLDVSLAGPMNGLEVCRALRAEPPTATTPIMMLSGWAFDSDLAAGREAGADDYLPKPFHPEVLRARVEHLIDWAVARPAGNP